MTLPTLSVPVEDKIEDDDNDNNSNTDEDEDIIDDKKRAERIETMERDISALHDRGDTSISSQDCTLFLALFEKFLSLDNNTPLQQEMMVEMLEDFGELVLGLRENLEVGL